VAKGIGMRKIEAFLICWNERDILPMVIRHYQQFCAKITIFDNYSSDGSDVIAEAMGCEVHKFGRPSELNDNFYLEVKNHCWKGSDADYVIVCDTDEILLYEDSPKWEGVTMFRTQGWQITSNDFPKHDLLEITNGFAFDNYSKNIIFSPKAIKEINYRPGAHRCDPVGDIHYSDERLYILHYRQIGGVERLIRRYMDYRKRMSLFNRKNGHGIHYLQDPMKIRASWKRDLMKSKPFE
jgi:glycosyltransferase involved in cell wall biosynthesis